MISRPQTRWTSYLALAVFFGAASVFRNAMTARSSAPRFLNPPPEHIEHFTFGFRESMADGLWLRWIQDGDQCQTYGTALAPGDPKPEDPRLTKNTRHRVCDVSWSYKMLDAVSRAAPRFKMPYLAGTMTLAVLVEDYDGASRLFDRGIEVYPEDWQILYRAAYHFLFDMKDLPKAADLLRRAARHGAPPWVNYLAARVYSKAGQTAYGIATLESYLRTVEEPERRREVERRIADIKRGAGDPAGR